MLLPFITGLSEMKYDSSDAPWAVDHPELLAVAKMILDHSLPEHIRLSLEEATKPREEAWPNAALRAGGDDNGSLEKDSEPAEIRSKH